MSGVRPDRAWIAGGLVAAALVGAGSWFFLLSPQFDEVSAAETQLADAQMANVMVQQRLTDLRKQSDHQGALQAEYDEVRAGVPTQHNLDGFTRQLSAQADAAGVTIMSISPGAPAQLETAPPEPPADADPASDTETTDEAPPAAATANLYVITTAVVTTGPIDAQRAFLAAIEMEGERRGLVTSASFTRVGDETVGDATVGDEVDGDTWTLTTQVNVFTAPADTASSAPSDEPGR